MVEGVTLVDTAEMYGNGASERIIGEILCEGAFQGRPVIATKFAPLPYRFSAKSLLSAVDKSLERLGIETIDLYQIHFPSPIFKINALMDVLAETVKAGKVRRVGVSDYGADQMRRAHYRLASHGVSLASNQVEYSLLRRAPETNGVLEASRDLGVTLIASNCRTMPRTISLSRAGRRSASRVISRVVSSRRPSRSSASKGGGSLRSTR